MNPIVFIGLGNMGWHMAVGMARSGMDLIEVVSVPGRSQQFVVEHGGLVAQHDDDALAGASCVVTMPPTSDHVASVLLENSMILRDGATVVDMTSGVPMRSRMIANELSKRQIEFIDCSVSGGPQRAETGDLALMAGGSEESLTRV